MDEACLVVIAVFTVFEAFAFQLEWRDAEDWIVSLEILLSREEAKELLRV